MAQLDTWRGEILGVSARVIQKKVSGYLKHKHFKSLRLSSITIQSFYRGQVARYQYERVRKEAACLNIQKHSRKFLARKAYKKLYFASVSIQISIRGMAARKQLRFKKQKTAAIVIRKLFSSLKLLTSILDDQEIPAAQKTESLLEANSQLEKQVEELTWQLQKLQCEKENWGANKLPDKFLSLRGHGPYLDCRLAQVATLEQICEARLKQATEAEMRIIDLKTTMQRLEDKISDMETEDKVLRQQALLSAPSRKMSSQLSFTTHLCKMLLKFGREDSIMRISKTEVPQVQDGFDSLIKCTEQNLGFSHAKPVAAFTIYKCLVYWRLLEAERTSAFDNLIQMIGSALESFRSSSSNLAIGVIRQFDGKYPAILFKQQLTAYYLNHQRELLLTRSKSQGCSPASHWQGIIESLNKFLGTLKENFVCASGACSENFHSNIQIYKHAVLNSFLIRVECCSLSNGEYVKYGLMELELWCAQATEENAGSSWGELKHTRQTVAFLILQEKSTISYDQITNELCPALSVQQLYRICWLFRDDKYNTPNVIASMKHLMSDGSQDDGSSTFLSEDDTSIPFTTEDIAGSMQVKEFADVKPSADLQRIQLSNFCSRIKPQVSFTTRCSTSKV
ncbi:hypothetical protein F3Y22_tig00111095pilonHSYRG00141 [Hibiscus syriacus]|uniref:Dilute domain-containing protein n=1 Tax=Hibiscus syriacus TaxID=106335 RepID=A0A6A2Z3D7_HIBSY|nr:hypothetical protein F3Y22_tig00111095pilonHSYRG00141 [Hibiscus syriacus]